ncbi:MAG: glutathione S-transferase family protein [Hyphomonadaceae bacterium]
MDELRHFRRSHYNEKARWALDWKRRAHVRRSLLPGLHVQDVRKRTGQGATPILKLDGRWIAGSSAIIAALEAAQPDPPLFPVDGKLRAEALAIEARFDEDWGPRIRRAVFGVLLETPGYIARIFSESRPIHERALYALMAPAAAPLIRKGNGIESDADIADGEAAADEAFAWVAERTRGRAFLVGDGFSVADLTAAAFLSLAIDMPGTPMARPLPMPSAYAVWLEKRRDHPAAAWVRGIYARWRVMDRDFEGVAPYAALATKIVPAE